MSKKLLAALIAFSMVGAFGCSGDDDSCTAGEKRCDGTVIQLCTSNSKWTPGRDCAASSQTCDAGVCVGGNNNGGDNTNPGGDNTNPGGDNTNPGGDNTNPGGNNTNPGGNNTNPGGDTNVGATCDPATYAGACSSDGSKRYYCDNTSSVIVEKLCNSGTVCEIQGVNSTKCVADPNCSATETKETSCSDGKDNDCDGWIDSNDHDCTGGGGNSNVDPNCTPSGDEAANCTDGKDNDCNGYTDKDDFACQPKCTATSTESCQKACKDDGSEGYYFSKGSIVTVKCENNDCNISNNRVNCGSGSGSGNDNSGNNGEACTKETFTPSCKDDLSEGYFCGSQGTVVTKKCSNNDCYNNDGYIDCGAPESCTGANNTGTCINNNANADVCVNGIIKHYTCYNSICRVNDDGTVYCPKDEAAAKECTGDNVSENGEVGQCCTPGSYQNSGCREDNTGTRCDSGGRVAVWTCEANETCQYDEAKKWYSCK